MTEPAQDEERRLDHRGPAGAPAAPRHRTRSRRARRPTTTRRRCSAPCCRAGEAPGSTRRSCGKSSSPGRTAGPASPRSRAFHRNAPGKSLAELEAAIDAEIERLKAGPIAEWEMEKARTGGGGASSGPRQLAQRRSSCRRTRSSTTTRTGSTPEGGRVAKVTAADVQRVARQDLVEDRPHRRPDGAGGRAKGGSEVEPQLRAAAATRSSRWLVGRGATDAAAASPPRAAPSTTQMVLKGKAPVSTESSRSSCRGRRRRTCPTGCA